MLELTGATVTIEAMGCQKEIAQSLTAPGADYVLARKKKHDTLYDNVTRCLDEAQATACATTPQAYHETVDGDHGRSETRRYWSTSDIEW